MRAPDDENKTASVDVNAQLLEPGQLGSGSLTQPGTKFVFKGDAADVLSMTVDVDEGATSHVSGQTLTDAGNGTDTGSLLVVNRTQYQVGFKRELLIESERDIQKRQTIMVASMRVAFEGRNANASDTAMAMQYNIT